MNQGIRRHPSMKGYVLMRQPGPMGDDLCVPETPELLNLCTQAEMQAATASAQPLREHATLADFRQQCPVRTYETFHLWASMNQVPTREAMSLAMEAGYATAPMQAAEHEPTVPEPRVHEPLMRTVARKVRRVLDSAALDGMSVSGSSSLEWLAGEGIVVPGMGFQALTAANVR